MTADVRERAIRWLADTGVPGDVEMLEFPHGYVFWPAGIPDETEAPRAVVDRHRGGVEVGPCTRVRGGTALHGTAGTFP